MNTKVTPQLWVLPMGRGGFSLPDLGRLKSPLPLETEGLHTKQMKEIIKLSHFMIRNTRNGNRNNGDANPDAYVGKPVNPEELIEDWVCLLFF